MYYNSKIQRRGVVSFPEFTGERIYMRPFNLKSGLPSDLKRWQPTVEQMLDGIETDEDIYLMVDQATVREGQYHRRPGLHIDGYWNPTLYGHGGHRGAGHVGWPPSHRGGHTGWAGPYVEKEGILLASDVAGAVAYEGKYEGEIKEGGDCSSISTEGMKKVLMEAGFAFAGNVNMLHESTKIMKDCNRTLVRLNVPSWSV